MRKDWRDFVWRNWPDRQLYVVLRLPPPRWGADPQATVSAVRLASAYWARPGVCQL